MPGVGDVGTSSFEFYEGIRILIPGFFAVSSYAAVSATLNTAADLPDVSALGAILGILAAGLLLYFVDAPAKAIAHRDGLPSDIIKNDWGVELAKPVNTLNMFFVMVDVSMPAPIRARGLYKGSIYKIGYESIVIAGTSALIVGSWQLSRLDGRVNLDVGHRVTLGIAAGALIIFAIPLAMTFDWLRNRHRTSRAQAERNRWGVTLSLVDWFVLVLSGGLVYLYVTQFAVWQLIVAASILMHGVFLVRMHRGIRLTPRLPKLPWRRFPVYLQQRGSRRKAVAPATLALPFTASLGLPYVVLAFEGIPVGVDWLALLAWVGVVAAALTLVIARGHEKGLQGAYATQKAWMEANRRMLIRDYFSQSLFREVPATNQTPPQT